MSQSQTHDRSLLVRLLPILAFVVGALLVVLAFGLDVSSGSGGIVMFGVLLVVGGGLLALGVGGLRS